MRIAMRVGGGAMIGVLFFLVVVTLVPFARRPRSRAARADRTGDPVARARCWQACWRSTGCLPAITRMARSISS